MRKRELGSEAPQGGILADAMGLGKTVMVLANITGDNIHRKRVRHDSQFGPIDSDRGPLLNGDGITLIVVPGAGLKEQCESCPNSRPVAADSVTGAKEIVKHCDAEAIGKVMQYSRTDQRSTQLPELLDRYRIV